jgi:hypothetical protein
LGQKIKKASQLEENRVKSEKNQAPSEVVEPKMTKVFCRGCCLWIHTLTRPLKKPQFDASNEDDHAATPIQRTTEGEGFIDLGKKKRATVREFKGEQAFFPSNKLTLLLGSVFIDIREFYGQDGDEKPGKKGIALGVEQVSSVTFRVPFQSDPFSVASTEIECERH